jgi:hypothetical protein
MSTGVEEHVVQCSVVFGTPGGGSVALRVENVTLRREDDAPSAVLMEALADEVGWAHVDAGGLLHLDPDARGRVLDDGLAGDEPLRIVAVLDGIVMRELAELDELDGAAIGARLRDGDPDDPLLDTRSWWALDVSGRIETPPGMDGELRAGLRTIWRADPPPVGMATVLATALEDADVQASIEEADDATWLVRFADEGAIGIGVAREATSQAIVYLALPRLCPADRRQELARLVALANFDLPIGCLEAHLESGQARVRTSADVTGDTLSLAVAQNLVGAARHLAGRWFPAVEQVIEGATADVAFAAA